MEGILKSAPKPEYENRVIEHETPETQAEPSPSMPELVPPDVYDYFGVSLRTLSTQEKQQIVDLFKYFNGISNNLGDAITEIAELERRLGTPHATERRFNRVYNWVKIQQRINSLEKQKQAFYKDVEAEYTRRQENDN